MQLHFNAHRNHIHIAITTASMDDFPCYFLAITKVDHMTPYHWWTMRNTLYRPLLLLYTALIFSRLSVVNAVHLFPLFSSICLGILHPLLHVPSQVSCICIQIDLARVQASMYTNFSSVLSNSALHINVIHTHNQHSRTTNPLQRAQFEW